MAAESGAMATQKALSGFFEKNRNSVKNFKRISDLQWELILLEPSILAPLHQVLPNENDLVKGLLCSIKITAYSVSQFICLETTCQFNDSSDGEPSVLIKKTYKIFLHMIPALQKLLISWENQLALIKRFLSSLAEFLKTKSLSVSLQPPGDDGLLLRLLISETLELKCHLIPKNAAGAQLSLTFEGGPDTFKTSNVNFKSTMTTIFYYIQRFFPSQSQNARKRSAQLSEVLNTFLLVNDTFNGSPFVNDKKRQWTTVSLKEPFALYRKLTAKSSYLHHWRLNSTLIITLQSENNLHPPCTIEETHKIIGSNKEVSNSADLDQFHCLFEDEDEALFPKACEILKSWLIQFKLVDLFIGKLSEFLDRKRLQFRFVSSPTQIKKFLILEIDEVPLGCKLMPPFSERPLLTVQAAGVTYKMKAEAHMVDLFNYLASMLPNALEKPKEKRKASWPKKFHPQKTICRRNPQPSSIVYKPQLEPGFLLALMKELKTILTEPSQRPLIGRKDFLEKIVAWQNKGCFVDFASGPREEFLMAKFGNKQLSVQFLGTNDGVEWKLRLSVDGKAGCLVATGSCTNLYGQLLACLEHFLEQEPEKFIVVEVKVESEDGPTVSHRGSSH